MQIASPFSGRPFTSALCTQHIRQILPYTLQPHSPQNQDSSATLPTPPFVGVCQYRMRTLCNAQPTLSPLGFVNEPQAPSRRQMIGARKNATQIRAERTAGTTRRLYLGCISSPRVRPNNSRCPDLDRGVVVDVGMMSSAGIVKHGNNSRGSTRCPNPVLSSRNRSVQVKPQLCVPT